MNTQQMFDLVDIVNQEENMNESLEVDERIMQNSIIVKNFFCSGALKRLIEEAEHNRLAVYSSSLGGLVIH